MATVFFCWNVVPTVHDGAFLGGDMMESTALLKLYSTTVDASKALLSSFATKVFSPVQIRHILYRL